MEAYSISVHPRYVKSDRIFMLYLWEIVVCKILNQSLYYGNVSYIVQLKGIM